MLLPITYQDVDQAAGPWTMFAVRRWHLQQLLVLRTARDAAQAQLLLAERELAVAVGGAFDAGNSWQTLGIALGVSRQAAQQRYGRWTTWADATG